VNDGVVGYYAHHHGAGHLRRAAAIIAHLRAPAALLTSGPVDRAMFPASTEIVELPPDHDPARVAVDPTAGGALHWAPLDLELLRARAARMVDWLCRPSSRVLVCDVSVEAALLARLCGVAPILVHQTGDRRDPPHRLGAAVSVARLCPYPEQFEVAAVTPQERARSHYTGILAPHRPVLSTAAARRRIGAGPEPLVVIVLGGGGHSFDPGRLPAIAAALPGWSIRVTGPLPAGGRDRWRVDGWVEDVWPHLCAADVVVATAGSNAVAEVAAAGRPLVCVPEARPFDEQLVRATRLDQLGLAVAAAPWPEAGAWPGLLERARALGGRGLAELVDPDAAARAAAWIEAVAGQVPQPC
jgi:UDP-N-acetylglucosamine--N-acetylmuramyl-(pentapeptide) pyrophosphoryl-undecaprenol N-acetylglucosamine transferase